MNRTLVVNLNSICLFIKPWSASSSCWQLSYVAGNISNVACAPRSTAPPLPRVYWFSWKQYESEKWFYEQLYWIKVYHYSSIHLRTYLFAMEPNEKILVALFIFQGFMKQTPYNILARGIQEFLKFTCFKLFYAMNFKTDTIKKTLID